MPIFPDHNLLFVHIPKNAGRSVEAALLGDRGTPDDGRRSGPNRAAKLLLTETASSFAREHLIGTIDVSLASQHLTYVEMEMLGLLPDGDEFHSFAIVRNPFDRALSSTMHFSADRWVDEADASRLAQSTAARLSQWLDRPLADHNDRAHRRTQLSYLRDSRGEIVVDSILRFENLAHDFAEFLEARGISGLQLPFRGSAGRDRSYRDYYDHHSRRLVEEAFGEDLDAFCYEF